MANLSIGGTNFNPDEFLKQAKLKIDTISYKGDPINRLPNAKIRQISFISKIICRFEDDNWNRQLEDSLAYLNKNKNKLLLASSFPGVEFINLDLALNSIIEEKLIQSFFFPVELIKICGELSISIETTLFAPDLEKKMEKKLSKKNTD